jgi:hypothetical protein
MGKSMVSCKISLNPIRWGISSTKMGETWNMKLPWDDSKKEHSCEWDIIITRNMTCFHRYEII